MNQEDKEINDDNNKTLINSHVKVAGFAICNVLWRVSPYQASSDKRKKA